MSIPADAMPGDAERPGERELIAFVREVLALPDSDRVSVYSYLDQHGGYRIGEVSTWTPRPEQCEGCGAGGSWMQSDSGAHAILFAMERFVVNVGEPIDEFDAESYVDYAQEMEQNLRYALTGEFGEWEDRRPKQEAAAS